MAGTSAHVRRCGPHEQGNGHRLEVTHDGLVDAGDGPSELSDEAAPKTAVGTFCLDAVLLRSRVHFHRKEVGIAFDRRRIPSEFLHGFAGGGRR